MSAGVTVCCRNSCESAPSSRRTNYDNDEDDNARNDEQAHLHVLCAWVNRDSQSRCTSARRPHGRGPARTFHHIAFRTRFAPRLKPCADTASVSA